MGSKSEQVYSRGAIVGEESVVEDVAPKEALNALAAEWRRNHRDGVEDLRGGI